MYLKIVQYFPVTVDICPASVRALIFFKQKKTKRVLSHRG